MTLSKDQQIQELLIRVEALEARLTYLTAERVVQERGMMNKIKQDKDLLDLIESQQKEILKLRGQLKWREDKALDGD